MKVLYNLTYQKKERKMKDLQKAVAHETLEILAVHYKTTKSKVAEAIALGNEKLSKEYIELSTKALKMILDEVE